jgi:peroxiredoxin
MITTGKPFPKLMCFSANGTLVDTFPNKFVLFTGSGVKADSQFQKLVTDILATAKKIQAKGYEIILLSKVDIWTLSTTLSDLGAKEITPLSCPDESAVKASGLAEQRWGLGTLFKESGAIVEDGNVDAHIAQSTSSYCPNIPKAVLGELNSDIHNNVGLPFPNFPYQAVSKIDNQGGITAFEERSLDSIKNFVVVCFPGAFTPTCTGVHLPSINTVAEKVHNLGFSTFVLSRNNADTLYNWIKPLNSKYIHPIADVNGDFIETLGIEMTTPRLGTVAKRCAIIVQNGIIQQINVDEDAKKVCESHGDKVLAELKSLVIQD